MADFDLGEAILYDSFFCKGDASIEPSKTVDITSNNTYTITPSQGYDGIAQVVANVNVPSGGGGITKYATFTAQEANSTIALTEVGTWNVSWNIKYSTDNATWNDYTMGDVITLTNVGDYVSFAGISNWIMDTGEIVITKYHKFVMTGVIEGSGNCCGLISQEKNGTTTNCFAYLFSGCSSLTTAPALPATTLTSSCYYNMFYDCTSLVSAPELPATNLQSNCYSNMFKGCTSLVNAPELPATTLMTGCYQSMFSGCTSLVSAPALPATTLTSSCYSNMFSGCTSLVSAPALPATTLTSSCYSNMFSGCTSLVNAPELPATTLAQSCYNRMFYGCTSIITAPELPATTLASSCYYQLFYGCSSLNYIKLLYRGTFSTTSTSNTFQWAYGVSSSGDIYYNGSTTTKNVSAIPIGWTIHTF